MKIDPDSLVVTDHAIFMYSQRRNDDRELHKAIERLDRNEIRRHQLTEEEMDYFRQMRGEILADVRKSIDTGHVYNHKPNGFILYRKTGSLPDGQSFALCGSEYGFVLKPLEEGETLIVTCLSRVGARR